MIFDRVNVEGMLPSTLYIMWPMQLQSLKLLRLIFQEEMHLQEHTLLTFDLWVKATRNVAQYSLHHGTYAATKFKTARSNCLGDKITRNVTDGRTHRQTDGRN